MNGIQIAVVVVVAVVALLLLSSVRIIKEYERGVAFRLGRLREPLGPGVRLLFPGLDKLVRVDLRVVTLTIPPQEVITKDNVPARVNAVVLFQVTDPVQSVMAVSRSSAACGWCAAATTAPAGALAGRSARPRPTPPAHPPPGPRKPAGAALACRRA